MSHDNSSPHWTLEKGYTNHDPNTYPRRVNGPGPFSGLYVLLKLNENDIDFVCRGQVQGFKVILHSPNELPRVSTNYFRVPLQQEVLVNVIPNIMTTSQALDGYKPERRLCYFEKERHLRFFKLYTENNCEVECLANLTLKKCGCVKFSMPRDNNAKICGLSDMVCYNDAEDELLSANFEESSDFEETGFSANDACKCLPSCTSISYEFVVSQAEFKFYEMHEYAHETDHSSYTNLTMSQMRIFFKDAHFMTLKRSELHGLTDFMANCGGLLGENGIVFLF